MRLENDVVDYLKKIQNRLYDYEKLSSSRPAAWQLRLDLYIVLLGVNAALSVGYYLYVYLTANLQYVPNINNFFWLQLFVASSMLVLWLRAATKGIKPGRNGLDVATPPIMAIFALIGAIYLPAFATAAAANSSIRALADAKRISCDFWFFEEVYKLPRGSRYQNPSAAEQQYFDKCGLSYTLYGMAITDVAVKPMPTKDLANLYIDLIRTYSKTSDKELIEYYDIVWRYYFEIYGDNLPLNYSSYIRKAITIDRKGALSKDLEKNEDVANNNLYLIYMSHLAFTSSSGAYLADKGQNLRGGQFANYFYGDMGFLVLMYYIIFFLSCVLKLSYIESDGVVAFNFIPLVILVGLVYFVANSLHAESSDGRPISEFVKTVGFGVVFIALPWILAVIGSRKKVMSWYDRIFSGYFFITVPILILFSVLALVFSKRNEYQMLNGSLSDDLGTFIRFGFTTKMVSQGSLGMWERQSTTL